MTLQIDENVAPVEVRIHRCHYDAHCRARNYRERGILTARHLDSMGRFLRLFETLCHTHGVKAAQKVHQWPQGNYISLRSGGNGGLASGRGSARGNSLSLLKT